MRVSLLALLAIFFVACGADPETRPTTPSIASSASAVSSTPVLAAPATAADTIATNGYGTCAVRASGSVFCWGEATRPKDDAINAPPFELSGIADATQVSLGRDSQGAWEQCLARRNGSISCWGDNRNGQVDPSAPGTERRTPVSVAGISRATEARVMGDASCAVIADGTMTCWSDAASAPFAIKGIANVAHISSAGECVVLRDGTVMCAETFFAVPKEVKWNRVAGVSDVTNVFDFAAYRCAARATEDPVCWEKAQNKPFQTPALAGAIAIYGETREGDDKAHPALAVCFLRRNKTVACTPDARSMDKLEEEAALNGAVSLEADGTDMCIVRENDEVACVGDRAGIPVPAHGSVDHADPRLVVGLDHVAEMSSLEQRTCARTADGPVACWGKGGFDGTSYDAHVSPYFVEGIASTTSLAIGKNSACVTHKDGTVTCRGDSPGGLYGPAGPPPGLYYRSDEKVAVPALVQMSLQEVASGVTASGDAFQWTERTNPIAVTKLAVSGAREAVVLDRTLCVVTKKNRVLCQWEEKQPFKEVPALAGVSWITQDGLFSRANGTVGTTTMFGKAEIAEVAGITDAKSVASAGDEHACAVRANGHVSCWGKNESGELGDGGYEDHGPRDVAGIEDAIQVVCGWRFSCALLRDGHVKCWGDAHDGVLGAGEKIETQTKIPITLPFSKR